MVALVCPQRLHEQKLSDMCQIAMSVCSNAAFCVYSLWQVPSICTHRDSLWCANLPCWIAGLQQHVCLGKVGALGTWPAAQAAVHSHVSGHHQGYHHLGQHQEAGVNLLLASAEGAR